MLVYMCNVYFCAFQIPVQYFRMELLHCEKLKQQQMELEKAKMDLVSASQSQQEAGPAVADNAETGLLRPCLSNVIAATFRVNMSFPR